VSCGEASDGGAAAASVAREEEERRKGEDEIEEGEREGPREPLSPREASAVARISAASTASTAPARCFGGRKKRQKGDLQKTPWVSFKLHRKQNNREITGKEIKFCR
jgi:hypothetical protein